MHDYTFEQLIDRQRNNIICVDDIIIFKQYRYFCVM